MSKKAIKTGKKFEQDVAKAYRDLGARKVELDKEIGGHQIDIYVEFDIPDGSLYRIAVEAKDYEKPVGIGIVRDFTQIVSGLRRLGQIERGVIVSVQGYSRPARNRVEDEQILELVTLNDLLTKGDEAKKLQTSLEDLIERLKPFEKLAVQAHPNLEVNEALRVLHQDIERLKEISAKHEFTPLLPEKKLEVIQLLTNFVGEFLEKGIKILITQETWAPATTKQFAQQLSVILREAGFEIDGPKFATVYLASPMYALEWGFNQNDQKQIHCLYSVLCRIISQDTKDKHAIRQTFPQGQIRIHFAGQTTFNPDGTVCIS